MTRTHIRHAVGDTYIGLQFGDLRSIDPHQNRDGAVTYDCRFEHGLVQFSQDVLTKFIAQAQQQLAHTAGDLLSGCSGALADLGGD